MKHNFSSVTIERRKCNYIFKEQEKNVKPEFLSRTVLQKQGRKRYFHINRICSQPKVWQLLKKLKIKLYDPGIPLLGIYLKGLKAGT